MTTVPAPTTTGRALSVVEVFGPTWQGEGPNLGRRAMFVRLAGCNLHCAWCDTPYSWDWTRHDRAQEVTSRTIGDLSDELAPHLPSTGLVVLTGGEPFVQTSGLAKLARHLLSDGWNVEVETNGTRSPRGMPAGVTYNVSPKLAHADTGPVEKRVRPGVLAEFVTLPAAYKFVATSPADVAEVAEVVDAVGLPADRVWIMPEGTDAATLAATAAMIAPAVLAAGYNLTTRLHVLAFGDKRGT